MDKADKATHEEKLAQRRAARALKAVLEKYRAETKLPVEPKQREVRMYDLKRRKVEALEELVELGRMTVCILCLCVLYVVLSPVA
ncbi:hypothetical protein L228DRAFT_249324 [Xylona heveae TC161]|uniref:Uncharacterized protein n=1 Tax=Xylona heveae (strain CBS 132557 / TC161) TaxID=1328760 RepID=A0A165AJ63_XYLHT|nr:hypothetical protein L228DRAFT_249324 [Xylona heveae TC161]KZF20568.1 hypothetical protein L228DRAFT_249324 [Xylona heveae TC161]